MSTNFLKKSIIPFYLLSWLLCSCIIGYYHEPWSDEAQSYLISRDTNILDLIKYTARMEGTPILWFLWLKICILLGMTYKYLYLTSIIPNFIGVGIFAYKAPFSMAIRLLFPLTYFIFYQYNIVSRSYSLIFLFVVLVAIYYQQRKEKKWLYLLSLMFLGQITIHTFILATGIFALGLYEDKKTQRLDFREISIYGIYMLITIAMLVPDLHNQYFQYIIKRETMAITLIRFMSSGLITFAGYDANEIIALIIGPMYFFVVFMELFNLYRKETFFLLIPVLIFGACVYKPWHSGIIILTVLLIFWLGTHKKLSRELKFCLTILFAIQIIWSLGSLIKDVKEPFSSGQEGYNFLVEKNIDVSRVAFLHFNTITICPYAQNKNCSYWQWKENAFAKKFDGNDTKYDAYVINEDRYKTNPSNWDNIQQKYNLSLKIIKTKHFVALKDLASHENLYIYYRK